MYQLGMSHLASIYAVWDGNAEALASDIGESGVLVRQWRNRGNIPAKYWQRIIDAAALRDAVVAWTAFMPPETVTAPALCTTCDHRLTDTAIRACSVRDCPHAQQEAA